MDALEQEALDALEQEDLDTLEQVSSDWRPSLQRRVCLPEMVIVTAESGAVRFVSLVASFSTTPSVPASDNRTDARRQKESSMHNKGRWFLPYCKVKVHEVGGARLADQ